MLLGWVSGREGRGIACPRTATVRARSADRSAAVPRCGCAARGADDAAAAAAWMADRDAAAALGIYGHPDVARWLSPVMDRVSEPAGMRLLLQQWIAQDARSVPPAGGPSNAAAMTG